MATSMLVPACSSDESRSGEASSDPSTNADGTSSPVPSLTPDAVTQMMASARSGLPEDPQAAARSLVHSIVTASTDEDAIGAVAEALRRGGLPIITGDGTAVALPDEGGYPDMPVYTGFLRDIARSVRSGTAYPATVVSEVFVAMKVSDAPLDWTPFVYTLAGWGKGTDDVPFVQSAASTFRALSAERGEPLDATRSAEETRFDTIQLLLLTAHAAAEAKPRGDGTASGFTASGFRASNSATSPSRRAGTCQQLLDEFANLKTPADLAMKGTTWFIKTANNEALMQLERDLYKHKLPPGTKGPISVGMERLGAAMDLLGYAGTLMTLAGITFTADGVSETHYKHNDGDTTTHRTLRVTARFDSGYSDANVACLQLAGVSIPKNGPLQGFGVEWQFVEDTPYALMNTQRSVPVSQGSKHLRVVQRPDQSKTSKVTDAQGVSTLTVKTPVEADKVVGKGETQHAFQLVEVKLTKNDWKLGDFTSPTGFAAAISLDRWLPTRFINVPITFHGPDPMTVKGTQKDIFLLVGSLRSMGVDLYSCNGPAGPWQGTSTYGGYDLNPLGSGVLDVGQAISPGFNRPPDSADGWDTTIPKFDAKAGGTTRVMVVAPSGFADIKLDPNSPLRRPVRVRADGSTVSVGGSTSIVLRSTEVPVEFPVANFGVLHVESDNRCGDLDPHWDSM